MKAARWGLALTGAALALEVILRTTAAGGPVWQVRGRADDQAGDLERAEAALERAVALSPPRAPGPRLALAKLLGEGGHEQEAATLLREVIRHTDPATRARGHHARSALYLEAAEDVSAASALESRARAADAARAALRLLPDDEGARWNLYLARPEDDEEQASSGGRGRTGGLDDRTARALESALQQVEARNLRESLAAILRELDAGAAGLPPTDPGTEGPPW